MTIAMFVTEAGIRVPSVTTEVMREIDRIAIEETGPNLYQMMENAGRSLALTVIDELGSDWPSTPILVVAGTGGNGGGGICAARHLANRGADVTLSLTDPAALGTVPHHQLVAFTETRGVLAPARDLERLEPGLIVDALIGYNLRGAPRRTTQSLIEWLVAGTAPVLSLDVPSGLNATTGRAPGSHVVAAATMTLALPKTGLDVDVVGKLMLADIGIPVGVYERAGIEVPAGLFADGYRIGLRPVQQPPKL